MEPYEVKDHEYVQMIDLNKIATLAHHRLKYLEGKSTVKEEVRTDPFLTLVALQDSHNRVVNPLNENLKTKHLQLKSDQ